MPVVAQPNWANRTLFHGDNLDFLRALNSESVHLIATDPPFNKGRDFHATPDSLASGASFQDRWSWKNDVHQEWIDQLEDDWPKVWSVIQGSRDGWGDDMGAFLCFMAVRLLEMYRILRKDGSMYLHCDPTASHYLKGLMDSIFSRDNFRSEIVWRRSNAHNKLTKQFGPIHDIILFYSKTINFTFHAGVTPYTKGYVKKFKEDDNGLYQSNNITGPEIRHGYSGKTWRGFNPTAKGRHWAIPRKLREYLPKNGEEMNSIEQLEYLYKSNLVVFPKKKGAWPLYKQYLGKGIPYQDIWAYQSNTQGILYKTDKCIDEDVKYLDNERERVGYPTQKPIGLYARMITSSSKEGDIILDPFCGCATTCVAAEKLGRQWVGMDIWDGAYDVTIERLKKEGYLAGPDGERVDLIHVEGEITYAVEPPDRTDDGGYAAPILKTVKRIHREPPGPKLSRAEMIERLQDENGLVCAGCDREFDDPRYLQLDHNTPRADGGLNHISNRILLCGPCNQLKSHTRTLSGLRKENKKRGFMQSQSTKQTKTKSKPKTRQRHLSSYR